MMSKIKVGDFVKALEGDKELEVTQNELGTVTSVGKKDKDGNREVEVFFTDAYGDFSYSIMGEVNEFERVGTKLKWVKPGKIVVGDTLVVDGDPSLESVHAEVFVVEQIDVYEESFGGPTCTKFSGEGYEVILRGNEEATKVPVVR